MAAPSNPIKFDRTFAPRHGEAVAIAKGIARISAPNAGPYTFTGTNSFLLGEARLAVIDPGPADPAHLDALVRAIAGRPVEAILITHTHSDHSGLARQLAEVTGAPLWFAGPHRLSRPLLAHEEDPRKRFSTAELVPDRLLRDGERLAVAGIELEVLLTPGHCANHLCFGLVGSPYLFSGDHVMGWNSSLIAVPDGSLSDYLASLEKVSAAPWPKFLPAHGGEVPKGRALAAMLRNHRLMRNEQILLALLAGEKDLAAIAEEIYPQVPDEVKPAARMTVEAHLEFLQGAGKVVLRRDGPTLSARLA